MINVNFDFHTDSNGKDPDIYSPTLRKFHQILWSKNLPNGQKMELQKKTGAYLFCKINDTEYFLGSDSITNSYRHHKSKFSIVSKLEKEVFELYKVGAKIGAYTLFPNKKTNGFQTINQIRGTNKFIDDRFDLTLRCIKDFYDDIESPIYPTLKNNANFFSLFENFENYIDFFLLNDLVDDKYGIKYFLPFKDFQEKATIRSVEEYFVYKQEAEKFISLRNERIFKVIK